MEREQTLHDRIIGLERENRRIRRMLCGVATALAAVPLLGSAMNEEPVDAHYGIVYASKFALKDPRTGKVRAQLAHQTMEGGWAGITLWDDEGQPRAEFKLWEDGRAHLLMMDSHRRELTKQDTSRLVRRCPG